MRISLTFYLPLKIWGIHLSLSWFSYPLLPSWSMSQRFQPRQLLYTKRILVASNEVLVPDEISKKLRHFKAQNLRNRKIRIVLKIYYLLPLAIHPFLNKCRWCRCIDQQAPNCLIHLQLSLMFPLGFRNLNYIENGGIEG